MTGSDVERRSLELIQGGSIAFFGGLTGRGLRFLVILLLGRVLGPQSFGLYALSYSMIEILRRLCLLGMDTGLVKFIPVLVLSNKTSEIRGMLVGAYTIVGFVGSLVGASLFVFSGVVSEQIFGMQGLPSALKVFAISLPFFCLVQLSAFAARSFKRMTEDVLIREVSHPFLTLFFCTMAFLFGYRLKGAVVAFLIAAVLSAFVGLVMVRRIFPPLLSNTETSFHMKRLLRFSLPVVMIGFSQLLLSQTDRIMIGYYMAGKDVGVYSAASTIAVQMAMLLNAFIAILSPVMAELQHEGKVYELEELLGRVTRWVLLVTVPIFLVLLFFPAQVMGIYGSAYEIGWSTLVIISFTCLFGVAFGPLGYLLVISGKQDLELINNVVMVTLNILLNIWLIPLYGIVGAAVATGSVFVLISLIRLVEVYWLMGLVPFSRKHLKPLGAALVAAGVGFFLKRTLGSQGWWLFGSAIVVLTYIASILVLRLEREDKEAISALRGIRP